ncbi:MAG: haloacid dehalogenase-like hydrolase [Oscillospiraceae bacterium]|nr:haloacid dehalogenase-like hydrolase [Oscillospiraceae bacterium]
MNVYDFDKTIFRVDSSDAFFRYCLRRYPRTVMQPLMPKLSAFLRYVAGGTEKDAAPLKEELFAFLGTLGNPLEMVSDFWEKSFHLVQPWYLAQSKADDVIISASPDFLVRPAAERLGVSLLATPMDPFSGRISGRNCHDAEKLRRFRKEYSDCEIDEFYSDSLSDAPLAYVARSAFLVKGEQLIPWPFERSEKR